MLLQALHKYATERKLLDRLPFQVRTVHLLIPLNADGSLRGNGFVPLTTPVTKKTAQGEKTEERPGLRLILPRFPGEKNNTRAQYLCDPLRVALGLGKDTVNPLPDENPKRVPDAVQQFRMFWQWIEEAAERLAKTGCADTRLTAITTFRKHSLNIARAWVKSWANPNVSNAEPELVASLSDGGQHRLTGRDVVAFEINGDLVAVSKGERWESLSNLVTADQLWSDWRDEFRRRFDEEVGDSHLGVDEPSICLVSEQIGRRVANIHKPEIKVPGTPPKGASFFSAGSGAFQSFGVTGGATASVSIDAAASYALAFEDLLASDDNRFDAAGLTFCFWAANNQSFNSANARLLSAARPALVRAFLKRPFAEVERSIAKKDEFLSVALSANGGRIVVREWVRVPLDQAIDNFARWFTDLAIAPPGADSAMLGLKEFGYAIIPKKSAQKEAKSTIETRSGFVVELYKCSYLGTSPSIRLLKPLVNAFVWALVTDKPNGKPNERKRPLSQARFALLKLILIRNHDPVKGEFMPRVHLSADTPDQAYNLGRLMAILARLQKKAHEGKLEGPGIVQRYYSGAASSPRTVFPVLITLHFHHIRKLEQQGASGVRNADAFRARIGDVLKLIPKDATGYHDFKSVLDIKEKARFALGFYQQYAYDRAASRIGHLLSEAKKAVKAGDPQKAGLFVDQAKQAVISDDYPDLCDRVTSFQFS